MIKTERIGYTPKSKDRAKAIEKLANAREAEGYTLLSVLSTPNCGAILVFRAPEQTKQAE